MGGWGVDNFGRRIGAPCGTWACLLYECRFHSFSLSLRHQFPVVEVISSPDDIVKLACNLFIHMLPAPNSGNQKAFR